MAAGILVYFINFFTGKSKNARVASAWFDAHKELLEANFALVGDDGAKDLDDVETQLVKESEHGFVLWCSGRVGCESMLVSSPTSYQRPEEYTLSRTTRNELSKRTIDAVLATPICNKSLDILYIWTATQVRESVESASASPLDSSLHLNFVFHSIPSAPVPSTSSA